MLNKIFEYAKFPSTWKGLFTIIGLLGYTFAPEFQEQIAATCIAIVGVISTLLSDADVVTKKKK